MDGVFNFHGRNSIHEFIYDKRSGLDSLESKDLFDEMILDAIINKMKIQRFQKRIKIL